MEWGNKVLVITVRILVGAVTPVVTPALTPQLDVRFHSEAVTSSFLVKLKFCPMDLMVSP